RVFLKAGIMENGFVRPNETGVPQGGPLSPILANIYLDKLDKELEARGLYFVRYADDTTHTHTHTSILSVMRMIRISLSKVSGQPIV
ncbi:reverse transcriptase domain-containing protein, partial [Tetragenococcus halophilus]|uniref:reverse transcriptase domain-containing protein n=1 Tax=Tetragenococcus halophilus TaxID=51669 RepID=UPI002480F5BC